MNDYIIYFTHDNLHHNSSGKKTTEIFVSAINEEYGELTANENAQSAVRFTTKSAAKRTIDTFTQSTQAEYAKMNGYNGPFIRPVRAQIPVRKHIKI